MNKRAMIMLYFCVFGFIAASFLFFRYADDYKPTGDLYLGEKQIEVFQTYQEADADIYYIQHAALLSSQKASKENFKSEFESELNSYLKYLELNILHNDSSLYNKDKLFVDFLSQSCRQSSFCNTNRSLLGFYDSPYSFIRSHEFINNR